MSHREIDQICRVFVYNPDGPIQFPGLAFFLLFALFLVSLAAFRNHRTGRVAFTTLFSLYFYYLTSGYAVFVLLSSVAVNFGLSLISVRAKTMACRKTIFISALALNIGFLLSVKYTNFFIDQINGLSPAPLSHLTIMVPLGVSFFTFQALSYHIDIYRQKTAALASVIDFTFYLSFFPKLLAGPLVRLNDFGRQVTGYRPVTKESVDRGLVLIVSGLLKKMVIADYIGVNFVDRIFASPLQFTGIENLTAVYAYALQIYCDFSGYTDIALGIALFMGYRLPPNFDSPYLSATVREFWQRWHISLSLWFRDYLYIPLGGNRHGKGRQWLNYLIIMSLCGFWHGASWNFILWGLIHGVGLIVSSFVVIPSKGIKRVIATVVTFHFVCFAWIFFRADSLSTAWDVMSRIPAAFQANGLTAFIGAYGPILILLVAGYALHLLPAQVKALPLKVISRLPWPLQSLILAGTIWLIMQVALSAPAPFIYLQF